MTKKLIVFLVEGKNDEREINAILNSPCFSKYREKYAPHFIIKHGDITTDNNVTASNILKALENLLIDFRRSGVPFHNVKVTEIQEFVHIVDLDGAFIQPEKIVKGETRDFQYTDTSIITSNVDAAIRRNRKKTAILKKLTGIEKIGGVNYSIYFASCNMDHLLFCKRMLTAFEKGEYAHWFYDRCTLDPSALDDSIFKQEIMADSSYEDSWAYIQQDNHSLLRHTNINLFLGERAKNEK